MTTPNMTGLYIETFSESLDTQFQQGNSRLSDTVTDGGAFVGGKLHLPMMGTMESSEFNRADDVLGNELETGFIDLVPKQIKATLPLYDVDKDKLTVAGAAMAAEQAKKAMFRGKDKIIYDALIAAQVDVTEGVMKSIGSYDAPINWPLLAQAAAHLGNLEAWDDGEMSLILPFQLGIGLGLDLNVANRTTPDSGVIKSLGSMLDVLNTLKVANYNRVNKPAGTATNIGCDLFLYNKSCIVSAHDKALIPINQQLSGNKLGRMIGAWAPAAAKVRNKVGVIHIKAQFNATLDFVPARTQTVA